MPIPRACSIPSFRVTIKHHFAITPLVVRSLMALALETIALLKAAWHLAEDLPADAILILTETNLDWDVVHTLLPADKLLVAAQDRELMHALQAYPNLTVLDIDPGPTPTQERMSLALLEAIALEKLKPARM